MPGTQFEPGFGEGDDGLMVKQKALEMNSRVAFEAALVLEVVARRSDLLEPALEILQSFDVSHRR